MLYKFPSSYIEDAYEFYKDKVSNISYIKDKPLPFHKFKRINNLFGKMLVEYVLLGREVGLPFGIGTIVAVKEERKNKYRHVPSYMNSGIDSENYTVLDRFTYKIKFRRNGNLSGKPITGFKFIPAWQFNNRLKLLARDGHGGRYSYLTSKTLYRNEI